MKEKINSELCDDCIHFNVCTYKEAVRAIECKARADLQLPNYMDMQFKCVYKKPYCNNFSIRSVDTLKKQDK
jgi:hypothetical protein